MVCWFDANSYCYCQLLTCYVLSDTGFCKSHRGYVISTISHSTGPGHDLPSGSAQQLVADCVWLCTLTNTWLCTLQIDIVAVTVCLSWLSVAWAKYILDYYWYIVLYYQRSMDHDCVINVGTTAQMCKLRIKCGWNILFVQIFRATTALPWNACGISLSSYNTDEMNPRNGIYCIEN
jgi:hypothetical protein